jgi:hypothetical protein
MNFDTPFTDLSKIAPWPLKMSLIIDVNKAVDTPLNHGNSDFRPHPTMVRSRLRAINELLNAIISIISVN